MQHHQVRTGEFTKLHVKDGINVIYRSVPDSAGLAVFDAPANMVNTVMFEVKKNTLNITVDATDCGNTPIPTVTVYSSLLEKAENSADSTLRIISPRCSQRIELKQVGNGRVSAQGIDTDEVVAKNVTGRGQIAVNGHCHKASLQCTGVGAIQADALEAAEVTATVNGPVTIGCHATELLTVQGTGPGTVYYLGTPEIKNRSISGKYKPL